MRVLNETELAFVNGGTNPSGETNCAALESDRVGILYNENMSMEQKTYELARITQRAAGCSNRGYIQGYSVDIINETIGQGPTAVTGSGLKVSDSSGNYIKFVTNPGGQYAVFLGGSIQF